MLEKKMISRRDFLKTTLTATAGAALLPLAGSAAAAPNRAAQSDVVILTSGWPLTPLPTEDEIAADPARAGYAEALQAWLDENPGVTFQSVEVNIWDQQAIVTAISGGTAPTYVYALSIGGWNWSGARAAFAQNLVADVTAAVEEFGLKTKLTPAIDAVWEPLTNVNGGYLGYPIDAGADMFWIRRDLLQDLGIAEPPADWTWDDLMELARALTSAADSRQGLGAPAWMAGAILNDHGYGLLRNVPSPETGWNWTRSAEGTLWGELLTNLRKLIFEDGAVYTDVSYTTDNYTAAFTSGATAINRTNILGAFGSAAQENSLAALASRLGKSYDEVFTFRGLPYGSNGFFTNTLYVGNVSISPDTAPEVLSKAVSAVDFMFLGRGWDIQKAGQFAASNDLQAVFNYPLPIDGKYTYDGVPGSFADAWGQSTLDAVTQAVDRPIAPDQALFFPVEQNPGPNDQSFEDAWANIMYVADSIDPTAELQKAVDTWNQQAAGFSSSVPDADFIAAAQSYFQAVDAYWKEASPAFYESTFKPWYDAFVSPALA